jgi:hypothetical protein
MQAVSSNIFRTLPSILTTFPEYVLPNDEVNLPTSLTCDRLAETVSERTRQVQFSQLYITYIITEPS